MDRLIPRLNGARGSALLAIGWTSLYHGIAYLPVLGDPHTAPQGLQAIASVLPLSVYGGAWTAVGCIAIVGAFKDRNGYPRTWDQWGFYTFIGILLLWSLTYYAGFAISVWPGEPHPNREWVGGGLYLGIAGLAMAAMRMRNPFVIDLRDVVIEARDEL